MKKQLCDHLCLCPNSPGPGGWGAANRLDYSYDDFLDTMQETPTSIGNARSSRIKRSAPLSDYKIKLIFNITGKDKLSEKVILWKILGWKLASQIFHLLSLLGNDSGIEN